MANDPNNPENPAPFLEVVAMSREDANAWAQPYLCHALDYLGQAIGHRFGAKRYRVWLVTPDMSLRKKWNAA